jgi:DNA-binding NtrC family response regulator
MSEQVLVIDDEMDQVDDILFQLQMRGITCRGETDPRAAVETFRAKPTDVVIVDYLFPPSAGVTGVDVIAELQAIKPFTQFILISGWIDRDLGEESLTEELRNIIKANRYFQKPIDLHKIVETVQDALGAIEGQSTDWKSIAQQYVSGGSVTAEEVRRLNERIKAHLIKAVDETREES